MEFYSLILKNSKSLHTSNTRWILISKTILYFSYNSYKWNFTEMSKQKKKKIKILSKIGKIDRKVRSRIILHEKERERERLRSNNTQEAAHASYRGNRSWLINLLRGHKFDAVNSDRFLYTWHLEKDVYGIYAFSSVHLFHALTHPTLKSVPRSRGTPRVSPPM